MAIDHDAVLRGEPRLPRQPIVWHDAGADDDEIGRDGAVLGLDGEPSVRKLAQLPRCGIDQEIDATRGVAFVDQSGELRVADPREDARCDLDHARLDAELRGGGGHLQPGQPAVDDQKRLALVQPRLESACIRLGAQTAP